MLLGDKVTFNILSDKEKVRKTIKLICFCVKNGKTEDFYQLLEHLEIQ